MQTPRRYDIYAFIHKGLRAFMADTLLRLGQLDLNDPQECQQMTADLLLLLEHCEKHLEHENDFIHAAMEARQPGSAGQTAADHIEHQAGVARLRELVTRLQTPDYLRAEIHSCLYQELALFIGENYVHMTVEENHNNIVLWQHYSDAEIIDLNRRLVASIPPDEAVVMLGWMARYLSPSERGQLFSNMRNGMPSMAFAGVLQAVKPLLAAKDWQKLSATLEAEAEPLAVSA